MLLRTEHKQPGTWKQFTANKPTWLRPILLIEWPLSWLAYVLSHWSFLEVLEYLGSLSVLVAVVFYFYEAPDRVKQKHYQAWQVINTAQHMGGSGGRIEALSELNADGVPLVGVNLSSAFLQGVRLPKAKLLRANFENADVRSSNLAGADLTLASLRGANLRQSDLSRSALNDADLSNADFCFARLDGANLAGATLDSADFGNADLGGIQWQQIRSLKKTNIAGVRNPPDGFVTWALKNGAVQLADNPNCPVSANSR
jgi:hypothetical protein